MSPERHHPLPSTQEDREGAGSQDHTRTPIYPELLPGEQHKVATILPGEKPKTRRIAAGIAAATLAAALAGSSYAFGRSHENPDETAPEPTVTVFESDEQPLPEGQETLETPLEGVTLENFPFEIDGKKYEGFEALKEEYGISAEKYPNPKEAARQTINLLNTWLNYDFNPEQSTAFEEHTFTTERGEYIGTTAVFREYINEAFSKLLVGQSDLEGAQYPQLWIDEQSERAATTFARKKITISKGDTTPYRAEYTLIGDPDLYAHAPSHDRPGSIASMGLSIVFTDNGDENSIGDLRMQPGGYQGIEGQEQEIEYALWQGSWDSSGSQTASSESEFGPYWRIVTLKDTPA